VERKINDKINDNIAKMQRFDEYTNQKEEWDNNAY